MQIGAVTMRGASQAGGAAGRGDGAGFAQALGAAGDMIGGGALTADQVSAAQGLPAGVYDFTRISPRQFAVVVPALVASGRIGAHALDAASDLAGSDDASDTPVNMFAYLRHEATANEAAGGGMPTAFGQRTALSVMARLHHDSDVPITYDTLYPGAPRAMTTEEATAKLKSAIADFRKESELTPAQRLAKRLRADVLREMKMSEDGITAMPPEQQAAIEKKIGEEVAPRMTLLGFADADGKARASGDWAGSGEATATEAAGTDTAATEAAG